MRGEYRKSSTWRRVGLLLAILAGLLTFPAWLQLIRDPLVEDPLPESWDFAFLQASSRYRLSDETGDGRVDCVLRVPVLPWARVGFYRDQPTRSCRGSRARKMPEGMAQLADELLAVRRQTGLSAQVVRDLDGDGQVDCVEFDGTWRYAADAACPEKLRSDAALLDDDLRAASDRILAIELELRSRWLDDPR